MKISQREARKLSKRVKELEEILRRQRNAFASEWPSSVSIAQFTPNETLLAKVYTARLLKHAVVVVENGRGELHFFASEL